MGVSVSPQIEVRNGDVEGFDARDSAGVEWLVLLYRAPLADRSLDNTTPPLTLSMERKDVGADGRSVETLVRHFDIVSTLSDRERELTSENLGRAAELLRVPETFEQGLCALDDLCGRGELVCSTFRPALKTFEAPLPGTPGFNLKDFEIRLKVWLHEQGVHYETWGRGEAKDIEDLAKELSEGEGLLSVEDGIVYLENKVVLLWLESPDGTQRLFEDYQEFCDGRIRRRRNLGALPAEKAMLVKANQVENRYPNESLTIGGEHPVEAVRRLLAEELGITRLIKIERGDVSVRLEPSQCYPGLCKRNTYIVHTARIDERDYRPSYEEVGPKRTTRFVWKPNPAFAQSGPAEGIKDRGVVPAQVDLADSYVG
jgi:hypothetical protein